MDPGVTSLIVTFNEALADDLAIDVANWTVRYNNLVWNVSAADVSTGLVHLTGSSGGADVGANVVSFAPPPHDVVTRLSGLPVLAFADFPVT